jgi:hypothetical protein
MAGVGKKQALVIGTDQLAYKLREKVISGEYAPGMYLREGNLAKVFRVNLCCSPRICYWEKKRLWQRNLSWRSD